MLSDLLILLGTLVAWTYLAYRLGRWVERRRHRHAGLTEPPTTRQLLFLAHLADEVDVTATPVRTRAEAAAAIDDLLEWKRLREEEEK